MKSDILKKRQSVETPSTRSSPRIAPAPASSSLVPSETPPIVARVLRQESAGQLRLFGLEFLHPLS